MSRFIPIFFVAVAALFLTACGPIYSTQYAYVPPASGSGKICISQCQQNRLMCQQLNESKKQNCLSKARQDALYEYEIYKLQREKQKLPIDKSPRSFERSWSCNTASDNCTAGFNACYSSCGGDVLEKQVCTAFCDK